MIDQIYLFFSQKDLFHPRGIEFFQGILLMSYVCDE